MPTVVGTIKVAGSMLDVDVAYLRNLSHRLGSSQIYDRPQTLDIYLSRSTAFLLARDWGSGTFAENSSW